MVMVVSKTLHGFDTLGPDIPSPGTVWVNNRPETGPELEGALKVVIDIDGYRFLIWETPLPPEHMNPDGPFQKTKKYLL